MKKVYIKPAMLVMIVNLQAMVCTSVKGVSNTGSFSTVLTNESTDEYLSRRNNIWDDEEDWFDAGV